mgnify:CR=1 FL=1
MNGSNRKSRGAGDADGSHNNLTLFEDAAQEEQRQPLFNIGGTYFATPNELIEIMRDLSAEETMLYLLVLRKTFGFHKVTSEISSKEIEQNTGLNREEMKPVRDSLKSMRLIDFEVMPFDGEKRRTVYSIPGGEKICRK